MKKFFRNLSIRAKLLSGFGIIGFILLLLGIQEYYVFNSHDNRETKVLENLDVKNTVERLRYNLRSDMEVAQRIMVSQGPNEMEDLISQHNTFREKLQDNITRIKSYSQNNTREFTSEKNQMNQYILDVEETYSNIITPAYNNIISLKKELMNTPSKSSILNVEGLEDTTSTVKEMVQRKISQAQTQEKTTKRKLIDQTQYIHSTGLKVMSTIDDIKAQNAQIGQVLREDISNLKRDAKMQTLIIVLAGLGVSVMVVIFISNLISKPIHELRQLLDKLGKGELPRATYFSGRDEIAAMANSLNGLVEGLKKTSHFAQEIGKGNFSSDYTPLSDNDVLGNSLLEMKESLKQAQEEEEKRQIEDKRRNWTTEGLSQFNDILRKNNDNLEKLSDQVIINLVKYIDANQGGIFVYNEESEEEKYLELKAAYAYDRKKYIEKTVYPGEGLVGMSFEEKLTYNLTEVPEEYVEIESGLGDSNPTNILIVPMVMDDVAYGVIELAALKKFNQYEINFIERVANSVASSISTLKINERTSKLLEQSQKQAEDMKEQEEKMRQNMEEMQATQEESLRREEKLKEQFKEMEEKESELKQKEQEKEKAIEELKEENEKQLAEIAENEKLSRNILESSLDGVISINEKGIIEFFNQSAEKLWGYSQDEVLGQNVAMLMPEDHAKKHDEYIQRYLRTGIKHIIGLGREVSIINKNGEKAPVHLSVIESTKKGEKKFTGFVRDLSHEKQLAQKRNAIIKNSITKEITNEKYVETLEKTLEHNNVDIPYPYYGVNTLIDYEPLELGVNAMDKEHRQWIDIANKLYNSIMNDYELSVVNSVIEEFKTHTERHFEDEMFYMKKFDFQEAPAHENEHNTFIQRLETLHNDFSMDNFETAYNLLMYLRNWIQDHIKKEDMKYVPLFKKYDIK